MDTSVIIPQTTEIVTPRLVYSLVQLRSIRGAVTFPNESPVETAAYSLLLKGRSNEISVRRRDQSQPQNKIFNGDTLATSRPTFVPEMINNISADHSGKWRQQQQPTLNINNRSTRTVENQRNSIHDQAATNSPSRISHIPPGIQFDNRDAVKIRSTAPQFKNMSSADQQRQQFEKERLEIEISRQHAKQLSGGNSDLKTSSTTPGRNPLYHDECDLLMDELAGNSSGSSSRSVVSPTPLLAYPPGMPAQSVGKSNLLLGAMGLTEDKRGQASQQGMKKISLDHIFAKSPPAAPPGIRLVATNAPSNGLLSAGTPFSYNSTPEHQSKLGGGINYDEIGSYLTDSGNAEGDDDYEESMRMIDRMICGDDDYDYFKEDRSLDVAAESQQISRYALTDSSSLPAGGLISKPTATSLYAAPKQTTAGYVPPHTSGVSLDVNTLFAAVRLHSENSNGIIRMSDSSEVTLARDRSASTDVLFKLGFGTQGLQQKDRTGTCTNPIAQQSQPATPQTPQRMSSNSVASPSSASSQRGGAANMNANMNMKMNMSPFAFHSSSSGGGSSGGGSRRSGGSTSAQIASPSATSPGHSDGDNKGVKLVGKSNISASSRQQLMKMVRGSTPNKPCATSSSSGTPTPTPPPPPSAVSASAPQSLYKQVQQQQPLSPPEVKAAPLVRLPLSSGPKEKESGLQRISISDLFKSSHSPAPVPRASSTP